MNWQPAGKKLTPFTVRLVQAPTNLRTEVGFLFIQGHNITRSNFYEKLINCMFISGQ